MERCKCLFDVNTTFTSHRGIFDHNIPLIYSSSPINERSYRYPGKKKDIIERLVQEMLDQGVIRPSSSPYASPVVLVGKKDESRLCIHYRDLNQLKVKDSPYFYH